MDAEPTRSAGEQQPWPPPPGRTAPGSGGTWTPMQPVMGPPPPQATPPPGGSGRGRGRISPWLWVAVIALVAGLGVFGEVVAAGWAIGRVHTRTAQTAAQSPIHTVPQNGSGSIPGGTSLDPQAIARKVDPVVVDLNTVLASTSGQAGQAAGTGIILTSSGEVLTNNHVVQGSTSIKVTIAGRANTYTATVVGVDPSADVALIQVQEVSGLPTATMADSSKLRVGQPVVAIGNALGQGGTPSVTQGAIVALNQTITASSGGGRSEQLTGLIQSDAPISPGDSGGPLVNASGQVIGMITAGETTGRRQTTTTIGYAIPSSAAVSVANQIRSGQATGSIILGVPGYLGVSVRNLDASTAAQLGLSVTSGALILGTAADSPAAQAGIGQNSVITAIDGAAVTSADTLGPAIQSHKPGQTIQVDWVDRAGKHSARVTLIAGPAA